MGICGLKCCENCGMRQDCGDCEACHGHPFGGNCIAAEAIRKGGVESFKALEKRLVDAFNALDIPGLKIDHLNLLNGSYVNMAYPLPNGTTVQFLNDNDVYLGNQIERPATNRCYGILTDGAFLLVVSYGCDGINPKLELFKQL